MLSQLGIGLSNSLSVSEVLHCADLAETYKLSFWLHEGYHNRSSVVLMSAVACRTTTARLGLGVLSPILRNPYLIAMDAGTLDELSGGRLILGLGLAASGAKRQNLDVLRMRPLQRMREIVHILRTLLAGETATSTDLYPSPQEGIRLGFAPSRKKIPIFIGAMGPRMIELSGEIADGVLFNYGCSLSYIEFAKKHVEKGLRKRKLKSRPTVAAFVLFSIAEKREDAVDAARRALPGYLTRAYPIALRFAGIPTEQLDSIVGAFRASKLEEARSMISEEIIERLTITGTSLECSRQIRKFADAGVEHLIAEHISGCDAGMMVDLIGREVSPMVQPR